MEENTVLERTYFSSSSALYDDWKQWCDVNREQPGALKQFSQKLEQRGGLTKVRREQGAFKGFC